MSKKAETTDAGTVRATENAPTSALTAVRGLMDERRRYESWLSGLDARRGTTPPRVFERVHADYTSRLEAVITQLRTHTEGLRAEVSGLTRQLGALHDEQQKVRDERAEAELRAHVGELAQDRWQSVATTADERIKSLETQHAELEAELQRTRELLADAERPATPGASAEGVAPTAASAMPASAVSDSAEGMAHVPSAEAVSAGASTETAAVSGGDAELPAEIPPAVIAAESELLETPAIPSDKAARPPRASSFDELAFLNSVVDTPQQPATQANPAARTDEQRRGDQPAPRPQPTPRADEPPPRRPQPWAASPGSAAKRDTVDRVGKDAGIEKLDAAANAPIIGQPGKQGVPLAANISGNHPIVLNDKPAEGAKTLKCSDCGAMNYPTEWYCERCGAELASL